MEFLATRLPPQTLYFKFFIYLILFESQRDRQRQTQRDIPSVSSFPTMPTTAIGGHKLESQNSTQDSM